MSSPPGPGVGERFPRSARLCQRVEFERCYREGRRLHAAAFTLHFRTGDDGPARLGVTVSRKVGGAVERHRLKRWAREAFRRSPERAALAGRDLLVHFKPGAATGDGAALRGDLGRLLAEIARRPRR